MQPSYRIDTTFQSFEKPHFLSEEWFTSEGSLHREDGPAWVLRDPHTNKVIYEEYRQVNPTTGNSQVHREDGPAMLWRDPVSGVITKEKYYVRGELKNLMFTQETI